MQSISKFKLRFFHLVCGSIIFNLGYGKPKYLIEVKNKSKVIFTICQCFRDKTNVSQVRFTLNLFKQQNSVCTNIIFDFYKATAYWILSSFFILTSFTSSFNLTRIIIPEWNRNSWFFLALASTAGVLIRLIWKLINFIALECFMTEKCKLNRLVN